MAILGPRDTRSLVLHDGWDAGALENYSLQDGTTFATVANMLSAGLAAVNAELYNDPLWSGLVSFQEMLEVEYRVGVSNSMNVFTEFGRPDPARADMQGHMLPLIAYDRSLEWTWDYLRKARMNQIETDIADALNNARAMYRQTILNRLLKRGDDSGTAKGLGSTGYSPGFATTAASTAVDFTPPEFAGNTFTSTHEHYVAIAGGAWTDAVFTDIKNELREHGHEPPYILIASTADEAEIRALTGTTEVNELLLNFGDDTTLSTLPTAAIGSSSAGGYFIGSNNDVAIRVVYGVPEHYGFAWKSYGSNNPRNPLRIRVQKGAPQAPFFRAFPDPRSGGANYPLQNLMLFGEWGVGVGADRTNGTARYVNNATWADGTAS